MNVLICVGSSCHLKGAPELVELFQKAIEENHLEGLVTLSGSFCTGQCNRVGRRSVREEGSGEERS